MSAITAAAYIQVHFSLDFIKEANTMNPGQTAPLGGEQSDLGPIRLQYTLPKTYTEKRADDKCCD